MMEFIPNKLCKIQSKEQAAAIVKEYCADKLTCSVIAKKHNLSIMIIIRFLKNRGIKIRKQGEYDNERLNIHFFDALTPESSWSLGWFYTDGNVSKAKYTASITVHSQDIDVLYKIQELMKFKRSHIYRRSNANAHTFIFSSKTIHRKLNELGCFPNKSLTIKFPMFLAKELLPSFFRGVFEGDGGFSFYKTHVKCKIASGSIDFLLEMQEKLKNLFSIKSTIYEHPTIKSAKTLNFDRIECVKFTDLIYENSIADMRMNRKYEEYLECKKYYNELPPCKNKLIEKHIKTYLKDPNGDIYFVNGLKSFVKELNLKRTTITRLVKGKIKSGRNRAGWSLPTQEEIDISIKNGALIIKDYAAKSNFHYIAI